VPISLFFTISNNQEVMQQSTLPFDSLPLRKDGTPGNAWGRFSNDDELGTLNLLTPKVTAEAAKEIVEGVRVSVDWPLDSMSIPCFGRSCLEHTIKKKEGRKDSQ
jgi:hypothetical protein